ERLLLVLHFISVYQLFVSCPIDCLYGFIHCVTQGVLPSFRLGAYRSGFEAANDKQLSLLFWPPRVALLHRSGFEAANDKQLSLLFWPPRVALLHRSGFEAANDKQLSFA
ncbi:hypothetical protein, partial [Sulfurovum sp.]|uniref:hypothetical protein n=1 Tax=Sulfurovum sp. TaxID=1969726 RepID=UPI0026236BC5